MKDRIVFEEYTDDREYRFQVYMTKEYYEVFVQKKEDYSQEYLPDYGTYYFDISDYKHIADSLERAVEIGRECIRNLIG